MSDIEKRARELLIQSFRNHGMDDAAGSLNYILGKFESGTLRACVDAIKAALTPPEGYVLVPLDVQKDAERYRFLRQYNVDSYLAGGVREQLDLSIDSAMLAERPEVP